MPLPCRPEIKIERITQPGEHAWCATFTLYEANQVRFDEDGKALFNGWQIVALHEAAGPSPEAAFNRLKFMLGGRFPQTTEECPIL